MSKTVTHNNGAEPPHFTSSIPPEKKLLKDSDAHVAKRNPNALEAFGFAFLSFIPVIGIFFGFAGIAMAIISLMKARPQKGEPGRQHAYTAYAICVVTVIAQLIGIAYLIAMYNQGQRLSPLQ